MWNNLDVRTLNNTLQPSYWDSHSSSVGNGHQLWVERIKNSRFLETSPKILGYQKVISEAPLVLVWVFGYPIIWKIIVDKFTNLSFQIAFSENENELVYTIWKYLKSYNIYLHIYIKDIFDDGLQRSAFCYQSIRGIQEMVGVFQSSISELRGMLGMKCKKDVCFVKNINLVQATTIFHDLQPISRKMKTILKALSDAKEVPVLYLHLDDYVVRTKSMASKIIQVCNTVEMWPGKQLEVKWSWKEYYVFVLRTVNWYFSESQPLMKLLLGSSTNAFAL